MASIGKLLEHLYSGMTRYLYYMVLTYIIHNKATSAYESATISLKLDTATDATLTPISVPGSSTNITIA